MFEDNKQVVANFINGQNGTLETRNPFPYVADDYVYSVKGTTGISGVHTGLDYLDRNIWAPVYGLFKEMNMIIEESVALEDGRILIRQRSVMEKLDGTPYNQASWYVYTVRDDKVVRAEKAYVDTKTVMQQY